MAVDVLVNFAHRKADHGVEPSGCPGKCKPANMGWTRSVEKERTAVHKAHIVHRRLSSRRCLRLLQLKEESVVSDIFRNRTRICNNEGLPNW